MKKIVMLFAAVTLVFTITGFLFAQDDTRVHPNCIHCGMDRAQFAKSRMLIEYDDNTTAPFCSLHCAAVDLVVKLDKMPKSILVGDYATGELIDAENAYWVLGGTKPGVMTKRGKWAFAAGEGARRFISGNGGKMASFDDVLKASYEDMNADTEKSRGKKKMKRMQ